MAPEQDEEGVRYTVRELLHEIRVDVRAIRTEQSTQGDRLTRVEGRLDTVEAVSKSKTAVLATVISLVIMLTVVGGLLITIASRR